jgi:uncharacterized protein (DUF362 family)
MTKVILRRAEYDYDTLKPLVFEFFDDLAGDRVGHASRVLIKPNLLAPAPPEKAMLTHPLIVRAAAEYVLQKGGTPLIADSPALGTFGRVMKESGIRAALKGLDVECREFKKSVAVDVGPPFNRIEIRGCHERRCCVEPAEAEDPYPDAPYPWRQEPLRMYRRAEET